jgi:hypothetical protein
MIMKKLLALLGVVSAPLALGLFALPQVVLVLAFLGIGLPPGTLTTLAAILGVLFVFATLGAVEIEVNFVLLFL